MKNKNYRNGLFLLLAAIFLTAIFSFPVKAMFDDLDPTFGSSGAVHNHLQLEHPQIVRQSDGKILKSGSISTVNKKYLHRFNADGSVDTSFGINGQAVFYNSTGYIFSIALQSDGKILFYDSYMDNSTYISRVNANGWYDSGFGTNGRVFLGYATVLAKISPYKPSLNAALQSIIILTHGAPQSSSVVRRLNYNGTFSTTFGTNGSISVPGMRSLLTVDSTVYQNSAIYTAGVQSDAKVFIKKYGGSGDPHTIFGDSGSATSNYGVNGGFWDGTFSSFILKNNKFYLTIYTIFNFTAATFMGKHSSNGTLENLQSCIFLGCSNNITYKIIGIYSDNTILVDGGGTIRKYSADTTTILDEFQPNYTLEDAVLQPDGKLITTDSNNTIRRYLP